MRSAAHIAIPMVCLSAILGMLLYGCAFIQSGIPKTAPQKRTISDIATIRSAESFTVVIKADRPLSYEFAQQDAPKALVIRFANAGVDRLGRFIFLPENMAVHSIRTEQPPEGDLHATVILALRDDHPYYLAPEGNSLNVVFTQTPGSDPGLLASRQDPPAEPRPSQTAGAQSAGPTGILKEVSIASRSGSVSVFMHVEGSLRDYKAFTIDTPPPARIVVDLEGLRSAFREEQRISVEGDVVKLVRHLGHPDKVRVVVQTEKGYLDKYRLDPAENGLVLIVGGIEEKEN